MGSLCCSGRDGEKENEMSIRPILLLFGQPDVTQRSKAAYDADENDMVLREMDTDDMQDYELAKAQYGEEGVGTCEEYHINKKFDDLVLFNEGGFEIKKNVGPFTKAEFLNAIIDAIQRKYPKIQVQYLGHGTKSGWIPTSDNDVITLQEVIQILTE